MNEWNTINIKRELFDLFDYARVLYNDYYRGFNNYESEDIEKIKLLLENIEEDTKNIKEWIQYE